jgi:ATP-dependent Clp protease ATP-binding subunit ClpA
MFERFTDRARRVVVLAQEEARMLGHNDVGTEHLLLGLIDEGDGVAAKALESLGISLVAVRQLVEEIIGPGDQVPSGGIPFTPRAKKVLELALRESLQLGHDSIGTEHILLGLIREGDGVAAQVLVKLGAEPDRVRQRVIELIVGQRPQPPREGAPVTEVQARLDSVEARSAAGQQRAAIGSVFGRWAEIVGPDLAAHTMPDSFADGEFAVTADSTAWVTQVRLLAPQLVRRLAAELGDGTVSWVKVRGPEGRAAGGHRAADH